MSAPNVKVVDNFLSDSEKLNYFTFFKNLSYEDIKITFYGKTITPKRKALTFADEGVVYTYSGFTSKSQPWSAPLLELKKKVEDFSGETFNYCLINYYAAGDVGLGQHHDLEPELVKQCNIPTLSLGCPRKMLFTRGKNQHNILLQSGSLLLLDPETNKHWKHGIPVDSSIKEPRISLTFRNVDGSISYKRKRDDPPFTDPSFSKGRKFKIEGDLHISVSPFDGEIKVHIREFQNGVVPLPNGICMDIPTFHQLLKKFNNLSLRYPSESFVVNNKIVGLCVEVEMHLDYKLVLKEFTTNFNVKQNSISLDMQSINLLCEKKDEVLKFILDMQLHGIFITRLAHLQNTFQSVLNLTLQQKECMLSKFKDILFSALSHELRKFQYCYGCAYFRNGQGEHACSTTNLRTLYSDYGVNALTLINYEGIASELANSDIVLSQNFFYNLTVDEFIELFENIPYSQS